MTQHWVMKMTIVLPFFLSSSAVSPHFGHVLVDTCDSFTCLTRLIANNNTNEHQSFYMHYKLFIIIFSTFSKYLSYSSTGNPHRDEIFFRFENRHLCAHSRRCVSVIKMSQCSASPNFSELENVLAMSGYCVLARRSPWGWGVNAPPPLAHWPGAC